MNALAFRNTQFDIVDRNGQPWLKATQLAEALGYSRADKISELYSRNADEFTPCMSETLDLRGSGNLRKEVRIFSLRGAHLLAMFARTEVAKEFRRWVLDVLDSTVAPAALPAPIEQQELTLDYEGRRLRIARLDGAPWLVAADLAGALKLRNSYVILRRLPEDQQRKVLFGKQQVNILNMDGVRRTLLAADQARADAFSKWLTQALEVQQAPSAAPLSQNLGREVRGFALDYLGRCQQAIRDAGGQQPEWDAANDQRLADGIAGLLIRDKRWMLTFGPEGEPKLKAIPSDAGVFTDKVLLEWIADPYGAKAELLPGILQAVTTRLAGQVGNRLTRG